MSLSFIQSAALVLACQTCSIVVAQPVQAQPSRQAESLAQDVARLAAKIRRSVDAVERDIDVLNTRKDGLHFVLEILKELENNPAEIDNGKALYRIGSMFEEEGPEDMGIATDPLEAAQWYRKAATLHNHVYSQYTLGMLYLSGKEGKASRVGKNLSEAAVWFEKAAEQGDMQSQFFLAVLLALGQGVRKDEDKAEQWLQKAEQGGWTNIRQDFEHAKQDVARQQAVRQSP